MESFCLEAWVSEPLFLEPLISDQKKIEILVGSINCKLGGIKGGHMNRLSPCPSNALFC
jgi:hypothetical protein